MYAVALLAVVTHLALLEASAQESLPMSRGAQSKPARLHLEACQAKEIVSVENAEGVLAVLGRSESGAYFIDLDGGRPPERAAIGLAQTTAICSLLETAGKPSGIVAVGSGVAVALRASRASEATTHLIDDGEHHYDSVVSMRFGKSDDIQFAAASRCDNLVDFWRVEGGRHLVHCGRHVEIARPTKLVRIRGVGDSPDSLLVLSMISDQFSEAYFLEVGADADFQSGKIGEFPGAVTSGCAIGSPEAAGVTIMIGVLPPLSSDRKAPTKRGSVAHAQFSIPLSESSSTSWSITEVGGGEVFMRSCMLDGQRLSCIATSDATVRIASHSKSSLSWWKTHRTTDFIYGLAIVRRREGEECVVLLEDGGRAVLVKPISAFR